MLNWRYYHSSNFFHFFSEAMAALIVGLKAVDGAEVHVLAYQRQVMAATIIKVVVTSSRILLLAVLLLS